MIIKTFNAPPTKRCKSDSEMFFSMSSCRTRCTPTKGFAREFNGCTCTAIETRSFFALDRTGLMFLLGGGKGLLLCSSVSLVLVLEEEEITHSSYKTVNSSSVIPPVVRF